MSAHASTATPDPIETLRRVFPKQEYVIMKMPDGDTRTTGPGASSWLSSRAGRARSFFGKQLDAFLDYELGNWFPRDVSAKYRIQAPEGPALLSDLISPSLGQRLNWALRDQLFITERGGSSFVISAANTARLSKNPKLGRLTEVLARHEERCDRPSRRCSIFKSRMRGLDPPAEIDQPR